MASAPSGSKVPPRSAGRREPQGGRSEEASQTGSKLESVASSSRAHDPRSSTHNITSADIRGVLEHVRGKPLPKVLDTVLAAEGAKQEVDSVGNSPTEEKSKEQPKVKGNLGTQDYPPIDTGNRWKKVDDKIEDKKLKALLDGALKYVTRCGLPDSHARFQGIEFGRRKREALSSIILQTRQERGYR